MKKFFATIIIALAAMFVFCSYCEAKSENTDCDDPYCRLVAAMELYEDEDSEESGISNDGNVHLFDLSGFYKSYYKNGLAWYASLKPITYPFFKQSNTVKKT